MASIYGFSLRNRKTFQGLDWQGNQGDLHYKCKKVAWYNDSGNGGSCDIVCYRGERQRRIDRRDNRIFAGYDLTLGNLQEILQTSTTSHADRIQGRINETLQCKNGREIGRFFGTPTGNLPFPVGGSPRQECRSLRSLIANPFWALIQWEQKNANLNDLRFLVLPPGIEPRTNP